MQSDNRPSFADANESLRRFLLEQKWSSNCVWLSEDRVRRKKKRFWLFQPDHDSDERSADACYREILATESSIKLIGIAHQAERSFIMIQKYRGDPGHFYMSLTVGDPEVVIVRNRLLWFLRSFDRGLQEI